MPNGEWRRLLSDILASGSIPTEDIEVYLTAKLGKADCFVSSNRKLLKKIADFECLTPAEFIDNYLSCSSD